MYTRQTGADRRGHKRGGKGRGGGGQPQGSSFSSALVCMIVHVFCLVFVLLLRACVEVAWRDQEQVGEALSFDKVELPIQQRTAGELAGGGKAQALH